MLSNDFEVPVAWVAGPFGSCIRACPGSRCGFCLAEPKAWMLVCRRHGRYGKRAAFQKREAWEGSPNYGRDQAGPKQKDTIQINTREYGAHTI